VKNRFGSGYNIYNKKNFEYIFKWGSC